MKKYYCALLCLKALFFSSAAFTQYNIILGRPTDHSIDVSILFEANASFAIHYGTDSTALGDAITGLTATAHVPEEVSISNLTASAQYFYRIAYALNGSGTFTNGPIHSFRTQRAVGEPFTFTIEADEHLYDKKGVMNLYNITLANQAQDDPDFMLSLGDTFGDDHEPLTITSETLDSLHQAYRPLLGQICHSIPFYFCIGNHEGESSYYYNINTPDNLCIWGTEWRKYYFPNPYPNDFYSGNITQEPYGIGYPENYYSWTWGDALFVVLDVYRYASDTVAIPHGWNWTLGDAQYQWLKTTLENSTANHKLVFAHHVRGYGRGGILEAPLYEWGGYQQIGGNYTFDTRRPNWAMPIHDLFVQNGVDIFFQGHDHVFAHEVLDDVVYQAMPMAADSTYEIGMLANADAYVTDTLDGSGHLRVRVTSDCLQVDYIRAYLPADEFSGLHQNGEVAFSYTLGECAAVAVAEEETLSAHIFPNPTTDRITWSRNNGGNALVHYLISDMTGRVVKSGYGQSADLRDCSEGTYMVKLSFDEEVVLSKILVIH